MPIWIHHWRDTGELSANDDFNVTLADRDAVIDDASVWQRYVDACEVAAAARRAVLDACRPPTDEERAARRVEIIRANAAGSVSNETFTER